MKLDSVRELKQALLADLMPALGPEILTTRSAYGVATASTTSRRALSHPPTVALGVALMKKKSDYRLAVRVQNRAVQFSPEVEAIRARARGEVDIRYIGEVVKRDTPWHQSRQRPLILGASVGHFRVTAGTLGCFVRRRSDGARCLLSNNHVLANENRGRAGDPILQPGDLDGGRNPEDIVAALGAFVRLRRDRANEVDAALGVISESVRARPGHLEGIAGAFQGLGPDFIDEGIAVQKLGRTTGHTLGRVTAIELDNVTVRFDIGVLAFNGQIEIESTTERPFSDGGDSGSVILNEDLQAVGLLFAGGDQGGANDLGLTYANPIHRVLEALDATIDL